MRHADSSSNVGPCTAPQAVELIAAALRGEPAPWPDGARPVFGDEVLDAAETHGVSPLLATCAAVRHWPERVRWVLRNFLRVEAARDAVWQPELRRVLEALSDAGIATLLLKGAQLSSTHYPRPFLRPMLDADVLIAPDDRAAAHRVLTALDYEPATHFAGTLVTNQCMYASVRSSVVVDVHWQVGNPHAFAGVLRFDELWQESVQVPGLGPAARGLSDVHALLLACVHRVAHHHRSSRLIWLYDIDLIGRGLETVEWAGVLAVARERRVRAVCCSGLTEARSWFATPVPAHVMRELRAAEPEPTAAFLDSSWTKAHLLVSDLRALEGWRARGRLVREHLFPPRAYIGASYGTSRPLLIRLAYVHRIITGALRWFRRAPRAHARSGGRLRGRAASG